MLPLKDFNPTRRPALVTMLIIAVCTGVYFFVQPRSSVLAPTGNPDELGFTLQNAAIPCEVVRGRPLTEEEIRDTFARGDTTACDARPSTPALFPGKSVFLAVVVSMFLHGSLLHLGGNMLYLWVFGNNIEDTKGKVIYVVFYLAAGLVATVAHIAVQPSSTVPIVGASGAIAGVMGAYLVLFPRVPIRTLVFGFFLTDVRAAWLLGFWFISQFAINPNAGVAWMAHVGGFVFGVLVGVLWRATRGRDEDLRVRRLASHPF